MKWQRIPVAFSLILKMLFRRRIVPVLLITIPSVFLLVVYLTTSERKIPFKLASVSEEVFLEVSEQHISLLFFAVASVGFLASFLALTLMQKNESVNKRLIICGYHPIELLTGNLLVLIVLVVSLALFVGLSLKVFFSPSHFVLLVIGLILSGFVYGSYGLAIGSLIKGELEGILFIVLLANLDAGWLQNPLFYAEAQNQQIIRYLPAYYPSQTAIVSAFSDYDVGVSVGRSFLYGFSFLAISMYIFFNKMKIRK